ncbi:MAG: DUF3383 domain-containing protein [bacterium]|nr:DUF3383 domain-containing protein [bacterium]
MPYRDSVVSNISLATTAATTASFSNILFTTTHTYFPERVRAYNSFDEVRADVPSDSTAYAGLRLAFSQPNGAPQPIYLGRREADKVTLTPDADRIGKITTCLLTVTTTEGVVNAEYTSTAGDDAEAICTALDTDLTQSDITVTVTGTGAAAVLDIVPTTTQVLTVTAVDNLSQSFTTTESAADLLTAILEEDSQNWYAFTCDDHTDTFIAEMAAEIEATGGSNTPKIYAVSSQNAEIITPLVDPADEPFGKLKELSYIRTYPIWSHNADTVFPETAFLAYNAIYDPGVTTYKFMQIAGVGAAADLVTGKDLQTAKLGYIDDRNASYLSYERGALFSHVGKVSNGEWLDVVVARDWMNAEIEARLTTLLLNQPGGKIPFTSAGRQQVTNVVDGVLKDSVDLGILSGYVPASVPEDTPFADQAARILDQVEFVGYLAGAIHFINVNGILTYADETLN